MFHFKGAFNHRNGLIRIESNREFGLNKPIENIDRPYTCTQCEPAPCIEACPVDAFNMNEGLQISIVDQEKCIGCEQCIDACPYNVMTVYSENEEEKAWKCDLCGGEPRCVLYCPVGALTYE
jgi:Fe-S-cluster-containing hydrogenase component 2